MPRSFVIATILLGALILVAVPRVTPVRAQTATGDLKELLEKRIQVAQNVFQRNVMRVKAGEGVPDETMMTWSERWLDAELAMKDKPADRISALKAHLERAKDCEKLVIALVRAGQARDSDVHAAAYFRTDAEIRLLEAATD